MADRRTFLRGLVSLPLIGGGITLIGAPSAPVPLVQTAALPAFDDPRQRARYAWAGFSAAMTDLTAGTAGWRINGAGGYRLPNGEDMAYCHAVEVTFDRRRHGGDRAPGVLIEVHRKLDLDLDGQGGCEGWV